MAVQATRVSQNVSDLGKSRNEGWAFLRPTAADADDWGKASGRRRRSVSAWVLMQQPLVIGALTPTPDGVTIYLNIKGLEDSTTYTLEIVRDEDFIVSSCTRSANAETIATDDIDSNSRGRIEDISRPGGITLVEQTVENIVEIGYLLLKQGEEVLVCGKVEDVTAGTGRTLKRLRQFRNL